MGNTSILLTLRRKKSFLNLSTFNKKIFLMGYTFLQNFKQLLRVKRILLMKHFLNISSNKIFLRCELYFQSRRLKKYWRKEKYKNKKKVLRRKFNAKDIKTKQKFLKNIRKSTKKKRRAFRKSIFLQVTKENYKKSLFHKFFKVKRYTQQGKRRVLFKKLFSDFSSLFNINYIFTKFKILNHKINSRFLNLLIIKFKPFLESVFLEKKEFYFDFMKIWTLYWFKLVPISNVLNLIALVFKPLSKKQYSRFLRFITRFFSVILKSPYEYKRFKGFKFVLSGRLRGKAIASVLTIKKGNIQLQQLNNNLEFTKCHLVTKRYGVFGFKLWMLRKKQ